MTKASYSIKDLEKLSGIKAHTIRTWEKRYGLIEPTRTDTNIRTYCDSDLKKILNVSMLNRNGYKISRIACLSDDEVKEKILHITQHSSDPQSQIENLTVAMLELNENKFEKALAKSIIQMGFERTIMDIIYPFFIKIGVMWQTGSINPSQEHFISNLTRQKFIVAIDSQYAQQSENSKTFIMFLPEGELHELGLLFSTYLLRKRGHKVIYLGQSVPFNDLTEIINIQNTDYLATSFFSYTNEEIHEFINKLHTTFPNKKVVILGGQSKELINSVPENFKLFHTPKSFIPFIDNL